MMSRFVCSLGAWEIEDSLPLLPLAGDVIGQAAGAAYRMDSSPVQFRIEGDSLVVRASDIEAGRPLFAREQN
jgi:hypothetical protein